MLINNHNCDYFYSKGCIISLRNVMTFLFCIVCHKGCGEGHYGAECSQVCGLCKNTVDCYHVNGTCLTGCESGYIGDMCKTRRLKPYTLFTMIPNNGCMLKQWSAYIYNNDWCSDSNDYWENKSALFVLICIKMDAIVIDSLWEWNIRK